jgi:hypothetical protein
MQRKKYEMTRGGVVDFRVWGETHCGPADTPTVHLRWLVHFTATGDLDQKGFLIDNLFILNWMNAAAETGTDLSCELLCDDLERRLKLAMCEAEPSLKLLMFELELEPDFGPDQIMRLKAFSDDL